MKKNNTLPLIQKLKEKHNEHIVKQSPPIYELLMIIINRGKSKYVQNVLNQFNIDLKIFGYGYGTAESGMADILGLYEKEKETICCFIPLSQHENIMNELDEKVLKKSKYSGIAFTIPLKSMTNNSLLNIMEGANYGE